jgi:hypothetical protein
MTSSEIARDNDQASTASEGDDADDARPPQLAELPEVLLAAVVAFADLKALGAGVALCRALRSASERLSPRLEYSLLLERFPLLSVAAPPIGAVSPRDLFRTYDTLEALLNERPSGPRPTIAHDAYTLTLELGVERTLADGQREKLSIHSGTLDPGVGDPVAFVRDWNWERGDDGAYSTEVPAGVFESADGHVSAGWDIYAKVVASCQIVGGSHALLYYGRVRDGGWNTGGLKFEWVDIPSIKRRNPAVAWALQHGLGTALRRGASDEQIELPFLDIFWNFPTGDGWDRGHDSYQGYPSTVDAKFLTDTPDGCERELSFSDVCVVFERLVAWSD